MVGERDSISGPLPSVTISRTHTGRSPKIMEVSRGVRRRHRSNAHTRGSRSHSLHPCVSVFLVPRSLARSLSFFLSACPERATTAFFFRIFATGVGEPIAREKKTETRVRREEIEGRAGEDWSRGMVVDVGGRGGGRGEGSRELGWRERLAKISRPPAAAAFRNEERREREERGRVGEERP